MTIVHPRNAHPPMRLEVRTKPDWSGRHVNVTAALLCGADEVASSSRCIVGLIPSVLLDDPMSLVDEGVGRAVRDVGRYPYTSARQPMAAEVSLQFTELWTAAWGRENSREVACG